MPEDVNVQRQDFGRNLCFAANEYIINISVCISLLSFQNLSEFVVPSKAQLDWSQNVTISTETGICSEITSETGLYWVFPVHVESSHLDKTILKGTY